jgi:NTP pyrophosphatase (non-canonical NTP hydrolase)
VFHILGEMQMNLIELIKETNPSRSLSTTQRRLMKIGEETGEVWQALLDVTGTTHTRNMTWEDVREELVDCFIVAIDAALAFNPNLTFDFHIRHIMKFDQVYFVDKMFLTSHFIYSLNNTLDDYAKDETVDLSTGICVSKSLAILFYELGVMIFPDHDTETEEELRDHFHAVANRKIEKWRTKYLNFKIAP